MRTDAHAHLDALLKADPGFPRRFAPAMWPVVTSVHDQAGLDTLDALLAAGLDFTVSAGIHPQYLAPEAETAFAQAISGARPCSKKLAAIGECGFDFYGDCPERVRNPVNEARQRAAFEFQLDTAERLGLPVVIHTRKAIDLVFGYTKPLARLRGVLFHSWNGPSNEALSLLKRGVNAFFSFGASIVNGNKRARASCEALPSDRLLLETDAPWQPPSGSAICRLEHIDLVADACARLRGIPTAAASSVAETNFRKFYGL
ncbi:MAG: TatD family hydrolase [Spirochaetes bacterium]|nr:TatD family hydrolase [Spirochaetota bacterium]